MLTGYCMGHQISPRQYPDWGYAVISVICYCGVLYTWLVKTQLALGVGRANTIALAILPLLSALLPVCPLALTFF